MLLAFFHLRFLLEKSEKVRKKFTFHNSIKTRQLLIEAVNISTCFTGLQLVYFIDSYEDNHNIVLFVTN